MKFYTISNSYIDFLKSIDRKVPNHYGGRKPFIGVVLEVNDHKYFAPLTSYKAKQGRIKDNLPTIVKLHERSNPSNKLGMILINNMIPVIESEIQLLNLVHVENRSFSSSGFRVVVTHKRSAISKGF